MDLKTDINHKKLQFLISEMKSEHRHVCFVRHAWLYIKQWKSPVRAKGRMKHSCDGVWLYALWLKRQKLDHDRTMTDRSCTVPGAVGTGRGGASPRRYPGFNQHCRSHLKRKVCFFLFFPNTLLDESVKFFLLVIKGGFNHHSSLNSTVK